MQKILILLSISLWITAVSYAQKPSISETDIQEEALFIQAMQEKILGNTEKAIALFERIVKEQKDNDVAYFQLSQLYSDQENEEKAFENIQKASTLDPYNTYYLSELAEQYEQQEVYSSAAKIYERLYGAGQSDITTLDKWAYANVRAEEYDLAMDVLDILEKQFGFTYPLAKKKYDVFILLKKQKKAEEILERLLELNPNHIEALHLAGIHYKRIGKEEKARDIYRQILDINPNDSKANIALASNFREEGQDQQFLNSISSILENPEVHVDVKIKEVLPYVEKLGDNPDAELSSRLVGIVTTLERLHPGEAKVYALGGDVYFHHGQPEVAIEKYSKAVELRPDIWSVWEHLLYLTAEHSQSVDLIKLTTKAKDYFPNQALVYYMSAIGQARMQNYDQALQELDEAGFMVGSNVSLKIDILSLKGTVYQKQGKLDQALGLVVKALEANPNHLPSLNAYSQIVLSQNPQNQDLNLASQYIEKGLSMDSNYYPLIASKGKLYYLQKQYNDAKDWLHKALDRQGGTDTALLEVLGDTYFQLQQIDQAVTYWKKSLEYNSPNANILQQKINRKSLIE